MPTPLPRVKVKPNQTWNAESVFASSDQFDAEVKAILDSLPAIKAFQGRLGESVDTFLEAMQAIDVIEQRSAKVRVYASMSSSVDANNEQGAKMMGTATSALAQIGAATSFVDPELLSMGEAKLRQRLKEDSRMGLYEHYINDLFRRQTHVRSAEVEELLGMLRDPFVTARNTAGLLANADFKFQPARSKDGKKVELTQSTFDAIL